MAVTSLVDVKFNNNTQNAVVLDDTAGVKTLVLWDDLSAADQATLTAIVTAHGGDAPMAAPSAGTATVAFTAAVTGLSATGFAAVTATAGTATINIGGDKTGASSSGLVTALSKGVARKYGAVVVVDGVVKSITFGGDDGVTLSDVVTQINTDLGAAATAAITGGNIVITSATTGDTSTVEVIDSGLFAGLTGFVSIALVRGVAARTEYTATINVDGVAIPIAVPAATATIADLNIAITTDLAAAATIDVVGGALVITSATTGVASSVEIADGDLFKSLTGFSSITKTVGAASLLDVLKRTAVGSASLFDQFNVIKIGAKPAVPPFCKKTVDFIYFDGTEWKYLLDDTAV